MSDSNNSTGSTIPLAANGAIQRSRRLGKGLSALLSEVNREDVAVAPSANSQEPGAIVPANMETKGQDVGLRQLSVNAIFPLPGQPRRHFDEEALNELAASIKARGIIQPVIVRPIARNEFQLVAGERRWRAAQKAGLLYIPALVRELDQREVMALALIENIQREDLNPVEEALAYQQLTQQEGMSQAEVAKLVDKSRSHIANLQRLLALPQDVLDHVASGALSMGHARAIIGQENASEIAKRAIDKNFSVRQVEALVRAPAAQNGRTRSAARISHDPAKDADIAAVQAHLEEFLGLGVKIKSDNDPRMGVVTIRYKTLDQLDLICQRLTGGDI